MDLLKVAHRASEKVAVDLLPSWSKVKKGIGFAFSDGGFATMQAASGIANRTFNATKSSIPKFERLGG